MDKSILQGTRRNRGRARLPTCWLPALIGCLTAPIAGAATAVESLKQLSIESLMNVEVYTASKKLETTQATASATSVITHEDLKRLGVTTVPDALRLVPGVQVGRVDANKWAVSMRGFASRESNKLLVLVDGRSIYDPLFSGTLWESQDFLIEDIDRIEVIRGPGGTLWGANAFNGVINIVTRRAADTLGTLVTARTGVEERYVAGARFGWEPAEDHSARVYVKGFDRRTGYTDTDDSYDASDGRRAGFRWDWRPETRNTWTLSGDVFQADAAVRELPTQVQDVRHSGRNVLTRWTHGFREQDSLQVQAFQDHVEYRSFGYTQQRDTYDLEVQHRLQASSRHQLVFGGGIRSLQDDTSTAFPGLIEILPLRRTDQLMNLFVQDTVTLLPDRLSLIAGLKYENSDYARPAWLPSVRVAWTPNSDETIWAAVSDATRVPSRIESDLTFFNVIRIGANFGAEQVRTYEAGRRQRVGETFWYDVVVFYNDLDSLRTGEASGLLSNAMRGRTRGIETAVRWQPLLNLRLDAALTYLTSDFELAAGTTASRFQVDQAEGLAPRRQASLRAAYDLPHGARLDATLRHTGDLPALAIASYTELDLTFSLELRRSLELSLTGRNLLHDHHREQGYANTATGIPTEVRRSAAAQLTWTR